MAQKTYNGVPILSRSPIGIISTTLLRDDTDSHARFLEVVIENIRIVNIYLPNGNPLGTAKFVYKLAWMDRLKQQMKLWLKSEVPTVIGGDFNAISEDIDCHKPASWIRDVFFSRRHVLLQEMKEMNLRVRQDCLSTKHPPANTAKVKVKRGKPGSAAWLQFTVESSTPAATLLQGLQSIWV